MCLASDSSLSHSCSGPVMTQVSEAKGLTRRPGCGLPHAADPNQDGDPGRYELLPLHPFRLWQRDDPRAPAGSPLVRGCGTRCRTTVFHHIVHQPAAMLCLWRWGKMPLRPQASNYVCAHVGRWNVLPCTLCVRFNCCLVPCVLGSIAERPT